MVSDIFLRKRDELFKLFKKGAALTPELEKGIVDVYGSRGERALKAIKDGNVTKLGERWFVRGKSGEYEIVGARCACYDYVLNVVTEKAGVDMCYHALAKAICESLDRYYGTGG